MSSLTKQFESMKEAMRRQQYRTSETHKIRTVNTIKWKQLMQQALEQLFAGQLYDCLLIQDLKAIIARIPEDKFIEAIINLQPYKPHFQLSRISEPLSHNKRSFKGQKFQLSPREDGLDEVTTSAGSILKRSELEQLSAAKKLKTKQELMSMFIEADVLAKEISSPQHPFAKIIEGYCLLLENKYRASIEMLIKENKLMPVDDLAELIAKDFKLIDNFFKISSQPIIDIFQLKDAKQKQSFATQIHNFITAYLRNHQRLCSSIRKIIRYHIKNSAQLRRFQENCPLQAEIQKFDIPNDFQIEGCFIYTTSQIITFSQQLKGKECLSGLSSIRGAIYKDIDEYYTANHQGPASKQVSSAIQLQVLKFSLVKLRIFAGEILSVLMLLSVLYGQEMAYHFDEASYIHSQLTIAFEAIEHNL